MGGDDSNDDEPGFSVQLDDDDDGGVDRDVSGLVINVMSLSVWRLVMMDLFMLRTVRRLGWERL